VRNASMTTAIRRSIAEAYAIDEVKKIRASRHPARK
jgi:hypothetical protein